MDATKKLNVLAGEFDCVIDKGCFDAILCGQEAATGAPKALMEVSKALKSGGVYIVVSHAASEFRLGYFDNPDYEWRIAHEALPSLDESEGGVHYIYVMRKI